MGVMTIAELIKVLELLPDKDTPVIVDGYEGGYHDLVKEGISYLHLKLNHNEAWYYGPHEERYPQEPYDIIALRLGK
jgi:hypothetical protein